MKKVLKKIPMILEIAFLAWVIMSFANINMHNDVIHGDKKFSKFNFFNIFEQTECSSANRKSLQLAQHEAQKGELLRISKKETNLDDLETLAHLIYGECGANWCSDDMQYYVGSVVLNRVKSNKFPNTIRDVVFQNGQYACTWDGNYYLEPDDRAYQIAQELLDTGSKLPSNVLFQAEFTQGDGIYCKEQNMYFCFQN